MLGEIKTDNKDFVILSFENYIVGDTGNYNYLRNADFYTYDQMKNGWDTDYLGIYEFKENYVSAQGYKVNLIEDTTGEDNVENYVSEKCAVFAANGIQYTLRKDNL